MTLVRVMCASYRMQGEGWPSEVAFLPHCQKGLHSAHYQGRPHAERFRQLHQHANCRAFDSALDQADVRAIKVALQPEPLLREPAPLPNLSESLAEGPLRAGRRLNLLSGLLLQQTMLLC